MSIRLKVILPYLALTLVVAMTGVYVVTRLVTNTLGERLTNQLLNAGNVVLDEIAKQDIVHLKAGRIIAYTRGMSEAIRADDATAAALLAKPAMGGLGVESIVIVNAEGRELLRLQKQADGSVIEAPGEAAPSNLSIAQALLASGNPNSLPLRQFGADPADGRTYYYTAIPVVAENRVAGVVVVGTSLKTLLSLLKNTSLADVTLYQENGVAIGSTFVGQETDIQSLLKLSISPEEYNRTMTMRNVVRGELLEYENRQYGTARGVLSIGGQRLGAFSVALPLNFIMQSSMASRNTYVVIYTIAAILVVAVGYIISYLIIKPLFSLVRASQAIAKGDLKQRSGIRTRDEIGVLAHTFDDMTERLQQRTLELEKTNRILQQMDKTKGSFIQISAHELRTPLTLIMGYAALLKQRITNDPEAESLAKGILEGSERMAEVVNSMLDVSRIDNKTLTIKKMDMHIGQTIQKVHKAFAFALEERRLKFETSGLDQLPHISADPEMLFKVFYHVIMNAIKYTPDGGLITVQGRVVNEAQDAELEIAVKDTGIGIDPQAHEAIFNKFYQSGEVLLHSSGKTKFKGGGPGLGLAIARGIIEAHHGRIWVESPEHNESTNPGSTFYIRLPIHDQKK
jgi:signal transduction histidine kinase